MGILTIFAFAAVLSIAAVGVTTFLVYRSYANDFQPPEQAINEQFVGPSTAFDRNGQRLFEYTDPNEGLRDPLSIDQISPYVIAATVATEDASFYDNPGVNFNGLARAAWENLTPFGGGGFFGGTGGSSITQQLVKNVYFIDVVYGKEETRQEKVERKVKESVLAVELKRKYSDNQILTWYLNQIGYGRRAYGIGAAAQQFFGKDASQLTLGEASYLAGLPQAPGTYSQDPEAARARQNEVLDLMIDHLNQVNKIPSVADENVPMLTLTVEDIEAARTEPLNFVDTTFDIQAPHFVLYVKDQVTKMCEARIFSPPDGMPCDQVVEQGGLKITTTIDLGLNALGQQIIEEELSANEATTGGHNAALVLIQPSTGEILAYVGSRNFNNVEIEGQNDIASSEQSLGSSMKMFTYLKAFEDGWVPSTFIDDKELLLNVGGVQRPVNNWNFSYLGSITVRKAMSESVNTAAVRTLMEVGEDRMREIAHRMGITDLRQGDCGPTITLGACEVKLVDQTFAYAVLANNGVMKGRPTSEDLPSGFREIDQVSVIGIDDADGTPLYQFDPANPATKQVVDPAYAYMVTDVLSKEAITWSALTIDRPAAIKTGTSEEFRDGVVMGYTPDLALGVWMGNADNSPMAPGTFSRQGVGPMWRRFMEEAHQYLNIPEHDFVQPDDIQQTNCNGRQEVFKKNTPTVKNGACRGPSGNGDATASPTPRGPTFPTNTPTPTPAAATEGPTPTPDRPRVFYYTTRAGDTVQAIADLFGIPVEDLEKANGITAETPLEPGTVLVIPLPVATPLPAESPAPGG